MTTTRPRAPAPQKRPPPDYGARLAQWIEGQLGKRSWRSFAMTNGIEPTRLIAWRRGGTPGLEQIGLVAAAFGVTRIDVLVALGFLAPGETETRRVEVMVLDVDSAIDGDPQLCEDDRTVLRQVRRALVLARDSV